MNILIEGWRGINHSYALVNQWQINELIKSSYISFKDVPFSDKNWNSKRNDSGLKNEIKNIIDQIKPPSENIAYDITYRISGPFNFDKKFNSKVIFVFATTEYQNLTEEFYINCKPNKLGKEENFDVYISRKISFQFLIGISLPVELKRSILQLENEIDRLSYIDDLFSKVLSQPIQNKMTNPPEA